MNRNLKILPYKNGSVSAHALAEALECKQIRLRSSTIHSMRPKTIINWGNSGRNLPPQGLGSQHTILNPLDKVSVAGNKLKTLQALSEASVSIPQFTTDIETATEWRNAGHTVVERHTLTGNSGDGIRIVDGSQSLQPAPLYTMYVKKQAEYRIHIMKGQVIDVQRKARSRDVADEDVNWQVRNRAGGFIFARGDANPPQAAIDETMAAVEALGLDFGAVDIIHNVRQDKVYVLEVNTACGLEGTTLERYTAAFQAVLEGSLPESVWEMSDEEFATHEDPTTVNFTDEPVEDAFAGIPDALQTAVNSRDISSYRVGMLAEAVDTEYPVCFPNGTVGEVMEVRGDSIRLSHPNTGSPWCFLAEHIENGALEIVSEPEEPQPEPEEEEVVEQSSPSPTPLQAGDRVRLLRSGYLNIQRPEGAVFEIERVGGRIGITCCRRRIIISDEGDGWERVTEETQPEPSPREFQVGDRVRDRTGRLFAQTYETVTVSRVVESLYGEHQVWFRETGTWLFPRQLELVPENNSEPTPSPVVQSTTGSKFLIAVDGMCFIEKGVFNSRQEAQADIDSGFHYNLKQMNPDKVFEIKEI